MNEAKQKFRLTSLERAWILYDVGNSAFVLLVATLIPIFFNALAEGGGLSSVEYLRPTGAMQPRRSRSSRRCSARSLAHWPIPATSKSHLHLLRGSGRDRLLRHGDGKHLAAVPAHLHLCQGWVFRAVWVFYDSMLSDVTVPDRMDEVSSKGYAWGYIGQLCALCGLSGAWCWGPGASASPR